MKPLVSVITTSLNRAQFLERTILSIKNQDYKNIEHIIIDGGSTDNTVEIIKKYEKTYNLKWISEKDKNCSEAYNKGFRMASGQVVCSLDSDDIYPKKTISKVAEIFENNPDIDIVFGDLLIADENDKIISCNKYLDFDRETLLNLGVDFSFPATFWRKKVQDKIGLFDEKYLRAGDLDFLFRMGLSGARFYRIDDFLTIYRAHQKQLTKSVSLVEQEREEILEKYLNKNITRNKKIKIYIKRIFKFFGQGDVKYILIGFLRKIIK
jgi:glycosyltransferase involved in cell wall biosynthesis